MRIVINKDKCAMASPYLSFLFFACFLPFFSSVKLINGKCLQDQRSYLLQFRDGVQINHTYSKRVMKWNRSADCCVWDGVTCDGLGHVIGLELDDESISPRDENWKTLFHLQYLEELNLAENYFQDVTIPMELRNLTGLKHLNLSYSGFVGQIPLGLSKMIGLVTLDLSDLNSVEISFDGGLKQLFQNLTELREIRLDGVYIPDLESDGCNAFSHLSKLQALSLRNCTILRSCPLFPSLSNLTSLTTIRLNLNALSTTVPRSLANFTNLRELSLAFCKLHGPFPLEIFQIPTLEILDVSFNPLLRGRIPQLLRNGSLKEIALYDTNFSGSLPDSIGFLRELSRLDLTMCNFHGEVPATLANLSKLEEIYLSYNFLSGRFPSYLFAFQYLWELDLSNNPFDSSRLEEFPNASSSLLQYVDLSRNNLIGFIPNFFFDLQSLGSLDLSFNSFQGTLRLDQFNSLQGDYNDLDLSYNNLSIDATHQSLLPQFETLNLASCNLKIFPELSNQRDLLQLELSANNITGEIPNWLWKLELWRLNLSVNRLEGFQKPYTFPESMYVLDLHSNMLKGEVPLPDSTGYVDYSNNYFTAFNHSDNSRIPTINLFISLSNNRITGSIPDFFCNQTDLKVLDLSNNFLRGSILECLLAMQHLGVLVLSGNNLLGHIPDTFNDDCELRTLDLSRNILIGKLPKSLANCESVEVVNVGSNNIEGLFPCSLRKRQYLRIVVLRANRFYGEIYCSNWDNHSWPSLQMLDISRNHFSGALPSPLFLNCGEMMVDDKSNAPPLQFTAFKSAYVKKFMAFPFVHVIYIDSVWLIIKGSELKLVKILSIFKTLDFSCNHFQGIIPKEIGGLRGLYTLNLSHNALTGIVPGSIGELTKLESLDLSMNQLSGRIPSELGNLTFLQYLNLSYNQLTGKIPDGRQIDTFSESSFFGNKGLCGFSLNLSCDSFSKFNGSSSPTGHPCKKEIDWEYVSAALGFSVGLGIILLFNFLNPTWWQRFNALILRFLIVRAFGVHVQ